VALRESLTNVDLFSGLSPQVLDDIVARGTKMKRAPGSIVVEQGATDSGLQLILDGTATIYVNDEQKATLNAGQYFGEISLIDAAPRSATVVAGPDGVSTFAMSPVAFSDLLDAHPEIARPLMRLLTARIRRLEADAHN
jgi:CRP/FNR family transcriptional regulator, cyclic AMP receptor protein